MTRFAVDDAEQVAERDRKAAERAAAANVASATPRVEEASELALAERARMAAELDAAREEIAALRTQVPTCPPPLPSRPLPSSLPLPSQCQQPPSQSHCCYCCRRCPLL